MIAFTSFPSATGLNDSATSVNKGDDDVDIEDDFETSQNRITYPGDSLTSAQTFMRGHGTYIDADTVVSSVAGTVERVNRLITVRPYSSRYNAEVGDLVVGRISEVQRTRWKVDINSKQDAQLQLASVNLPGGIQRRKLDSDELQMRTFFEEGDLLVAEVQAVYADGLAFLHTRSLKYGKLRNGQITYMPPILVRRLKSHFLSLACGVDVILGLNGYIWVSKPLPKSINEGDEGFDSSLVYSNINDDMTQDTRLAISLICSIIRVLAAHYIPVNEDVLNSAYGQALDMQVNPTSLLADEMSEILVSNLRQNL